jgi:hypothetical protein
MILSSSGKEKWLPFDNQSGVFLIMTEGLILEFGDFGIAELFLLNLKCLLKR